LNAPRQPPGKRTRGPRWERAPQTKPGLTRLRPAGAPLRSRFGALTSLHYSFSFAVRGGSK
jgi:hypothetical protein